MKLKTLASGSEMKQGRVTFPIIINLSLSFKFAPENYIKRENLESPLEIDSTRNNFNFLFPLPILAEFSPQKSPQNKH